MQTSQLCYIVAFSLPGLFVGFGITWIGSQHLPAEQRKALASGDVFFPLKKFWRIISGQADKRVRVTLRDVCGIVEACWAVMRTSAAGRLAKASDGRFWIFNNESPLGGAYDDGFDLEMVRAPSATAKQNHSTGEAHQCIVDRCAAQLSACSRSNPCRGAWTEMLRGLGSVVDVALLRPDRIAREDTRELASCFFSRCLCVAALAASGASSHVARFPNAVDADDVKSILSLAESIAENARFVEERSFGSLPRGEHSPLGGQRVTYLQSRFATDPRTARLYTRLRELVVKADAQSSWRRVHEPTLVPRTIELLNYTSSAQRADAGFSLGWHIDEESALTAILLLSDPASFSGGELYHLAQGERRAAHARQHELLVYRSHTPHAVGALTAGTRLAVALEFWHVHGPGEGIDHPHYPYRRMGTTAPDMTTLGRCPK